MHLIFGQALDKIFGQVTSAPQKKPNNNNNNNNPETGPVS